MASKRHWRLLFAVFLAASFAGYGWGGARRTRGRGRGRDGGDLRGRQHTTLNALLGADDDSRAGQNRKGRSEFLTMYCCLDVSV